MRKRIVKKNIKEKQTSKYNWLNLESLAEVELSSEDEAYPIEAALIPGSDSCWRATEAGEQTLRLLFDAPQQIKLVRLEFHEDDQERTQEFVLRWSADSYTFHDIARQQYNFSSPDSSRELEDYCVDLNGVTALELCIIPDISKGSARASLASWGVA
ncbi:MAG: hypothetical protein ACE5DY_04165 [Mariprofundaceae bacterium]